MAGIYIHIPFCKKRCSYCDFFSSTLLDKKQVIVQTIVKELNIKKAFLDNEKIETIYLGGGTPSLLNVIELNDIVKGLRNNFIISDNVEFTIEANPDDIDKKILTDWLNLGINRLSIGIQSTDDKLLKFMNRRHTGQQAINCVRMAKDTGFDNISLDLIYGIPGLALKDWELQLFDIFKLPLTHLSAYHLTIEEGTIFGKLLDQGKISEIEENDSLQQFELLIDISKNKDFEHYEISNFCKSDKYSKHNKAYWEGKKYFGAGPSAHSFNQKQRGWNASDLQLYINDIDNNQWFSSIETLSEIDKYNEFIMTRLRTKWGINVIELEEMFGSKIKSHFLTKVDKYVKRNLIQESYFIFTLTRKGIFIADSIITDLFLDN
jgi:oxygen-independent coproporphyrinogen III oxidase